jgi:L-aminopeptidase/D-esterase-like protein
MPDPRPRHDDIRDVPGILVGHDTDLDAATGCTVVRCATPAVGAVDVRGGAPATRETNLLDPLCMMHEVHAILLTGGSAFGLDAAAGVMRALEADGIGYDTGVARVPIVPAAALFDLGLGRADVRPDAAAGERATRAATASGALARGSVGAGTGATVAKLAGPQFCVKGGIGSASATLPDGHVIGGLVAVNAIGDIYDAETGQLLAGARAPNGAGWLDPPASRPADGPDGPVGARPNPALFPGANTTIAVVATDAPWSKADLAKIAQMAHDGLALAVRPVHTPFDGDTIFTLSTASDPSGARPGAALPFAVSLAGAAAARVLARAVADAIRSASTLHGVPALRDLPFAR